jgi:hypothetical protein
MELLKTTPTRSRATRLAWIAVVLSGAGCAVFQSIGGKEVHGSDFPHRVHVDDEGLDCIDCHPGAEDQDEAGMPVLAQCRLCHEETEEATTAEQVIDRLYAADAIASSRLSALPDETIFSHVKHVATGMECAACHGEIGASDFVTSSSSPHVGMDDCMRCHAKQSAPNECATCHSVIGKDWMPASHEHAWIESHGQVALAGRDHAVDRCELCHQDSSCQACHQDMRPRSHNNYWRQRGHSVEAKMDRASCLVCHRTDYCDRCHREVQPASHAGSWGSPMSTHCFSCHMPLSDNGCIVCHRDTPSHLMAAPKPPDHLPGMNCRQCHGIEAPLPHVDNGDDCNACHR